MQTLLNLLAGVSLLVWGTHIIRTGILRLYGGDLRRVLRNSVAHRATAFLAGLGVTGLIQSSTATALIVAAFAGQGLIATAPALAVILGADVGTSLVTVVLAFDLSWLAPLLIFVGVTMFLTRQATSAGRFGRILIGLGLIIFALQWIGLAHAVVMQVHVGRERDLAHHRGRDRLPCGERPPRPWWRTGVAQIGRLDVRARRWARVASVRLRLARGGEDEPCGREPSHERASKTAATRAAPGSGTPASASART